MPARQPREPQEISDLLSVPQTVKCFATKQNIHKIRLPWLFEGFLAPLPDFSKIGFSLTFHPTGLVNFEVRKLHAFTAASMNANAIHDTISQPLDGLAAVLMGQRATEMSNADVARAFSGVNKDPMNPAKLKYTVPLALPTLPTKGLNFLLVDDDDICLFIHRRVLELTGYCSSAHSASNGKTALDILRRADAGAMPLPDIILLDLEMPLMNGLAFLEAFCGLQCVDKQRIAIVLLTSSVSEADRAYAMSMGVKACLSKPLTQENLNFAIRSIYTDHFLG